MFEATPFLKKSVDNLNKNSADSIELPVANQRDIHLNPEEGVEDARRLESLLSRYSDRRVLVLGCPCIGKSTLLQHIKEGVDMDIIFDKMPKKFKRYVLHQENPFMYIDGDRETVKFTEKIFSKDNSECMNYLQKTTDYLAHFINLHTKVVPGRPVFGTCVIETDVIIYLDISSEILKHRINARVKKTHRPLQEDRVFGVKSIIEREIDEIRKTSIPVVNFNLG